MLTEGIKMATVTPTPDTLLDLKTALENKKSSIPQLVSVEFLTIHGKLAKAVNSEDASFSFLLRDEEYEVKFTKPIYVTNVSIYLDTLQSVRGMRFTAVDLLTGKPLKVSITNTAVNGNTISFLVNAVITSFTLQKGTGYFSNKLKKIEIAGIYPEQIETFESEYEDLVETKDKFVALAKEKIDHINSQTREFEKSQTEIRTELSITEERLNELEVKKVELSTEIEELNESAKTLTESLSKKKDQDAILTAKHEELEKRKIGIESELSQKTETLKQTNIYISQAEDRLKNLVSNVNVFSEEFSVFVAHGSTQVKTYIGLALIPLSLLCIVVFNLFKGAVDLSLKYEQIPGLSLLTLFVTRLPFVIISALIVGVSVKIFFYLINRVIAIHQQRLDLAKIAIIAKDVSDSSANGLEISTQELYEAKTYLKMNILKAYLSDQLSSFSYNKKISVLPEHENLVEGESVPATQGIAN